MVFLHSDTWNNKESAVFPHLITMGELHFRKPIGRRLFRLTLRISLLLYLILEKSL